MREYLRFGLFSNALHTTQGDAQPIMLLLHAINHESDQEITSLVCSPLRWAPFPKSADEGLSTSP